MQTYGTTLEGLLRNSANQVFTIATDNALTLNTWQFVALTYDGSTLAMYHDGELIGSTAASGTSPPTGLFRIGNMPIRVPRRSSLMAGWTRPPFGAGAHGGRDPVHHGLWRQHG
ncbi:MAG: hypothetical protein IPK70_17550 [Flavobacteriales bacterium]|nr:hypothetical protein [Flavobacteriales bacterium]